MRLIRRFWAFAPVAVLACGGGISAPPPGFPNALAQHACGPADGPALAIYLAPEPAESPPPATPYVRVFIDQSVDQLDGRSWPVNGRESRGGARYQSGPDTFENATSGFVSASSASGGKVIEGTVNLTFPKAGHVAGGFRAPVFENSFLCGSRPRCRRQARSA